MLRIHPVCIELVRRVGVLARRIEKHDRDQARQLRRSSTSIVLNLVEGAAGRGGNKRLRYRNALGSAEESRANLEVAVALGYVGPLDAELRNRFNHVIGTLVKLAR